MSMYNLMFGENPTSDAILATLGLSRRDTGRFRDCFIAEGKIAIYTRNGGGNRDCCCLDDPKYGNKECKHHEEIEEVDETIEVTSEEAEKYPKVFNVYIGSKRLVGTGKRILRTNYICEEPDSINCACHGCVISYRLPKHPLYIEDIDDDFDCTYATIYFKFPEEYADELKKLDIGEEFNPSARWLSAIEAIKGQ